MGATGQREVRGRFRTIDGIALEWRGWLFRDAPIWRSVVFHHGLGEHCGRYESLQEVARQLGCNLFSYDARGHGLSPGGRGDAPSARTLAQDLDQYLEFLRHELDLRRPALLGHSMGGLIVSLFALHGSNQWHLQSLCLSAPGFSPRLSSLQKAKELAARALLRLQPGLNLATGLPADAISRDRVQVARYVADPLVHDRISVRLAISLIEAGKYCLRNAGRLRIPCLLQHGDADQITDPGASMLFFQRLTGEAKEMRLYRGGFHEIYNEAPDVRDPALNDLCDWLEAAFAERAREESETPAGDTTAAL